MSTENDCWVRAVWEHINRNIWSSKLFSISMKTVTSSKTAPEIIHSFVKDCKIRPNSDTLRFLQLCGSSAEQHWLWRSRPTDWGSKHEPCTEFKAEDFIFQTPCGYTVKRWKWIPSHYTSICPVPQGQIFQGIRIEKMILTLRFWLIMLLIWLSDSVLLTNYFLHLSFFSF